MPIHSPLRRVADALTHAGIRPGERLLLAVSGGVDSMVLLNLMVRLRPRLGFDLQVAHVHHGLRGEAADQDAAFVGEQAAGFGLHYHLSRLSPQGRRRGASVQLWAREARYACLETIRLRVGAARILTAHTQDDQAETVLLNLLRGTGPRGLAGIPEVRGPIVRPLLSVARAEVEAYAARYGVPYREDLSNRSDTYQRNRVRHHLLPRLAREYNPRIVETLAGLAALLREDDEALAAQARDLGAEAIRETPGAVRVEIPLLQGAPPAVVRRLFLEAFRRASTEQHGLTRRHLAALQGLMSRAGSVPLPGGLTAWRSTKYVWVGDGGRTRAGRRPLEPAAEIPAEVRLRPGAWTRWEPGRCLVRVRRLSGNRIRLDRGNPTREVLGPALLDAPLSLRGWQPGDRFQPLGLAGEKKLQDFFVDAKVPREARGRIPLLIAGGQVAWVIGHRISEAFRWRGESVACLAEIRYLEEAP